MSRSFWSLFIGYLCAIVYGLLTVYVVTGLMGVHDLGQSVEVKENETIDPDMIDHSTHKELFKFTRKQIAGFTIKLIDDIIMLAASIFLIIGVKKERHSFMAPWVFMGALSIFVILVSIIISATSGPKSYHGFVVDIVAFVIAVGAWYPIFKHYRSLKKANGGNNSSDGPYDNCMMNPPTAPLYAHVNAYPCAPPAAEFVHSTTTTTTTTTASAPAEAPNAAAPQ